MGGWAVACSPILRTTITILRLEKRGYETLFRIYERSKMINVPPRDPNERWCQRSHLIDSLLVFISGTDLKLLPY